MKLPFFSSDEIRDLAKTLLLKVHISCDNVCKRHFQIRRMDLGMAYPM